MLELGAVKKQGFLFLRGLKYLMQAWLDRHGPFDVIVDGANVGLYNQNFSDGGFSFFQVCDSIGEAVNLWLMQVLVEVISQLLVVFRLLLSFYSPWLFLLVVESCILRVQNVGLQLNSVVNGIKVKLGLKKEPLILLHHKRTKGGAAASPSGSKALNRWKEANSIYTTPTGSNDDWCVEMAPFSLSLRCDYFLVHLNKTMCNLDSCSNTSWMLGKTVIKEENCFLIEIWMVASLL